MFIGKQVITPNIPNQLPYYDNVKLPKARPGKLKKRKGNANKCYKPKICLLSTKQSSVLFMDQYLDTGFLIAVYSDIKNFEFNYNLILL